MGLPNSSKLVYRPPELVTTVTEVPSGAAGLSIVIPAWNEEDRLRRTLDRFLPTLESRGDPFEIIVVSDGNLDRTAAVAQSFASRGVRILRFAHKLGKGGAILAGIREARYEYTGYLDADGPIAPDQVYRMVDALRECDCVVASRWTRGSVVLAAEPLSNRIMGRGWSFLVRSLMFLPLRDTQCGAKFFKRSVVLPLLRTVTLTNRAFDVDFLYHIRKAGGTLREEPVRWTHDSDTRMPIGKAVPIMFLSLLGMRVMNLPISRHIPDSWVAPFQKKWGAI